MLQLVVSMCERTVSVQVTKIASHQTHFWWMAPILRIIAVLLLLLTACDAGKTKKAKVQMKEDDKWTAISKGNWVKYTNLAYPKVYIRVNSPKGTNMKSNDKGINIHATYETQNPNPNILEGDDLARYKKTGDPHAAPVKHTYTEKKDPVPYAGKLLTGYVTTNDAYINQAWKHFIQTESKAFSDATELADAKKALGMTPAKIGYNDLYSEYEYYDDYSLVKYICLTLIVSIGKMWISTRPLPR